MISIVIPAYQEGAALIESLDKLYQVCQPGECIVVDASDTAEFEVLKMQVAKRFNDVNLRIVKANHKGRASQMNQGALMSKGSSILFLHADTVLPDGAMQIIQQGLDAGCDWGRFNVRFDNKHWPYRMIAAMMNLRSCSTGIITGDQAMFMTRAAFDLVGGFDEIPLMEDIGMSKKLKRVSAPLCIKQQVLTSARRWENRGIVKTILLMWWLRFSYWLGVSPNTLANWY